MVEQVHYSIDKEPEICAQFIAEAIKAKPIEHSSSFKKAIDQITERVSIAVQEMILKEFLVRRR